jgi:ABC-type branched-subunit amino acid transport system substrate-binding protein
VPSRLLACRLARTGCAWATLALLIAGCTTAANTGTSVSGGTLTIYLSVPAGKLSPEAQDVLSAEQLAFKQLAVNQDGGKIGKFRLKLVRFTAPKPSDTARQAIGDGTTIAYLGEIAPGASGDTIGITNGQDVLQVSPTDTALELTQSTPVIPKTPDRYYESFSTNGHTFARLVPNTGLEAAVVASQMLGLGVKRVYVTGDGSEYGRVLRALFLRRVRTALKVTPSPAIADAVFYAGSSASGAASAFDRAVAGNPKVFLFAPSALAQNSFAASLPQAAQKRLYVSSPGFTASGGPAPEFVSAFRNTYGHAPATQAVFGFAAMQAVLHALQQAGSSAGNRKTVVKDFFAIRNFGTAVGGISISKAGDANFSGGVPFVFSRVKAGKLIPEKAVREQG